MSYFLLHFSVEHSFCLVVLGDNDGDKIYFILFFLYVTIMVFWDKVSSIC